MKNTGKSSFKIIIDECVSNRQLSRFEAYVINNHIQCTEYLKIAETHSGIPDTQIIHHLLNKETILVTNDRPLHNKVLAKGFRCFYIDDERITGKRLSGIKITPDIPQTSRTGNLKTSYHLPQTEIRPLLLPTTEKQLKSLRTKRRRIRNHFGGLDNLDQVAITVSYREVRDSILIGVKIRISSSVGIVALDASESYMQEIIDPQHASIAALDYALMLAIMLMLNSVTTRVFFDTNVIDLPDLQEASAQHDNKFYYLFSQLYKSFAQIEFIATHKGNLIDRLRAKLINLSKGDSNEIRPGNLVEIAEKVKG